MSREIKFRAWDRDDKIMYWFDLMWGNYGKGDGHIGMVEWGLPRDTEYMYNGNQTMVDPEDCEIMRCTGVLDKNDKEIYEGDVIKCICEDKYRSWNRAGENESLSTTIPEIRESLDSVVYRNGTYYIGYHTRLEDLPVNIKRGDNFHGEYENRKHSFEVVGNIYQHPHLLTPSPELLNEE